MSTFMDHVPERYHSVLRDAIDAVTETKILLDQVETRFGTREPDTLRGLMGSTFDGIVVTEEAVTELQNLLELHRERRAECQALMDTVSRGDGAMDGPAKDTPADEGAV